MYRLAKQSGETANFSIILPGACNAKCEFCFWKRSDAESPMYAQQLMWYLAILGDKITQISITGGEPTISPVFDDVINALRQLPNKKIVLTTNGAKLKEKLLIMEGVVQHINISRHAVDDEENSAVFKTDSIPAKDDLEEICDIANSLNMDVTLNKVVPSSYDDATEFYRYIKLIKDIGASSLALRKDYSADTLNQIPLEKILGGKGTNRSCPVCATNSYLYKGVPVHFKMSLEEPSNVLDWIYEFVYHPAGMLAEDWEGLKPIEFQMITAPEPSPSRHSIIPSAATFGGCGQASSRSGC